MKKLFLFLLTLTITLQADLSVKQIEEMVHKIHKEREGVKLETLEDTKEPFVRLQEENNVSTFVIPAVKTEEEAKLVLHAVVNGKAFINESWMKVNDNILGYQLKYIGNKGVVLRNENHIKKLFLRKQENDFIKLEEK